MRTAGRRGARLVRITFVALILGVSSFAGSFFAASANAGGSLSITSFLEASDATIATQLAQQLVGSGVTVENATYTGATTAAATFTGGGTADTGVGFDGGIVLSTGTAIQLVGPNTTSITSTDFGLLGDPDLDALAAANLPPCTPTSSLYCPSTTGLTHDAAVLEFDAIPAAGAKTVSFQYVFGSEEYPDFVGSVYNDVFGFYVTDGGTQQRENCATIPGTTSPVSINTVNAGTNAGYFRDNPATQDATSGLYSSPYDVGLNGLTTVLTCTAPVTPGVSNHLKLAIADTSDGQYDSAVFIQAKSLTTASTPTSLAIDSPAPVNYASPLTVVAHLTAPPVTSTTALGASAASGVASEPLTFSIGDQSGQSQTDATGTASYTFASVLQPPGVNSLTVTFAGASPYLATNATAPVTVQPEPVALDYIGPPVVDAGAAVLAAQLHGVGGAPLTGDQSGHQVTFTLTRLGHSPPPTPPPTFSSPTDSPTFSPPAGGSFSPAAMVQSRVHLVGPLTFTATTDPTGLARTVQSIPGGIYTVGTALTNDPLLTAPSPPLATVIATQTTGTGGGFYYPPVTYPPAPSVTPTPTLTLTPPPTVAPTRHPGPGATGAPRPTAVTSRPVSTSPPAARPTPSATVRVLGERITRATPLAAPAYSSSIGSPTPSPANAGSPATTPSPAPLPAAPFAAAPLGGTGLASVPTTAPATNPAEVLAKGESPFVAALPDFETVSHSTRLLLLNAALAGALLLMVTFPAELFNGTLKENYDEIRSWLAPVRRPFAKLPEAGLRKTRVGRLFGGLLFVLTTGVIYGAVDPTFGFTMESLRLVLGLSLGLVATTIVGNKIALGYARKRYQAPGVLRLRPGALLFALGCVLLSRAVHFEPGYVYGLVAGFQFSRKMSPDQDGRAVLTWALWLLGLAAAGWFALYPVKELVQHTHGAFWPLVAEAFCAALAVEGLTALVLALAPLTFMEGERLFRWNKYVWAAVYGVTGFAFLHIVVHPDFAGRKTAVPLVTWLVLFIAFATLSVSFWGFFKVRHHRHHRAVAD
ncbi:MAG TPA: FGLLP motif-containing membrane protein [Mycobacteriales bacterium]|nr:FGLLP motif-containing membrane protein [Mycobacteriales bacterium]